MAINYRSHASIATDSDAWPGLNRIVDRTTKDSLKSPWKDKQEIKSDVSSYDTDTESDASHCTCIMANANERTCVERNSTRNICYRNVTTRRCFDWMLDGTQSPRRSSVGRRKSQKYHWTGKFNNRGKKYSRGDLMNDATATTSDDSIIATDHGDVPNDTVYNYNLEAFDDEKTAKKTKIFDYNKFNLEDEGRRIEEDTRSSRSGSFVVSPRNSEPNVCENSFNFYGGNEERDEEVKSQSDEEKKRRRLSFVKDSPILVPSYRETSLSRVCIRKRLINKLYSSTCCHVFLSILKNLVLFSVLPGAYVAVFMYARKTEEQ